MSPPTFLEDPAEVQVTLDPTIDFTAKDAEYLSEACESFTEGDNDAVARYQGLDRESACNYVIRGFTVQGALNLEQQLLMLGFYTDTLRSQLKFYKKQLEDRYKESKNVGQSENP